MVNFVNNAKLIFISLELINVKLTVFDRTLACTFNYKRFIENYMYSGHGADKDV